MSAAHLYISVWFQIKFSEVETEELRFGEQCVLVYRDATLLGDNVTDIYLTFLGWRRFIFSTYSSGGSVANQTLHMQYVQCVASKC